MSINVSKQKREDLLAKIKAIRTYIATAPQDENTAICSATSISPTPMQSPQAEATR